MQEHYRLGREVFTPDGSKILVTELTSNHLSIFHVNKNGMVTDQSIQ
ncbi:hypothetical protein PH210_08475 [Paenibacillus sp. BSR1-1]|nr:hypothetical protein [Paenibacillus sp. BSR1-1]MDN3016232.1 hypothetical protein [Paenibacillus sp. BSR1-1]